jgi:hypothetical protein
MTDEPLDMEAAGFAEPDGPHPIAGLGRPAADDGFSAAGLTPAVVVTRCGLTEALKGTRQHQHLTLDARGQLADEIMAHLPAVPAAPLPFGETGPTHPCGCGPDEPCAEHADVSEPDTVAVSREDLEDIVAYAGGVGQKTRQQRELVARLAAAAGVS